MIINFTQTQMAGGVIVFPEFTPVPQPAANPIVDEVFLPMSSECSSPSITGSVGGDCQQEISASCSC